jgi:hypothetical protein
VASVVSAQYALGDNGKPSSYDSTIKILDTPSPGSLPPIFNWDDYGVVSAVKDQGTCDSSWAFAAVAVMESRMLLDGEEEYDFAEQRLVSCAPNMGCCGGDTEVLLYLDAPRLEAESCNRYEDLRTACPDLSALTCSSLPACTLSESFVSGYYTVATGQIGQIKSSVFYDGPAYFRFDVYDDFFQYWANGGIEEVYHYNSASALVGGHAVEIIGWSNPLGAWLCKNSWGSGSGPNGDGTFYIGYEDAAQLSYGMASFRPPCDSGGATGKHCLGPLHHRHQHGTGRYDLPETGWVAIPGEHEPGYISIAVLGNTYGSGIYRVTYEITISNIMTEPPEPEVSGSTDDGDGNGEDEWKVNLGLGGHEIVVDLEAPCFGVTRAKLYWSGGYQMWVKNICIEKLE